MTKFFLHTVLNLYKKKGHAKLCVSFDDNKTLIKLNTIMIVRMRDYPKMIVYVSHNLSHNPF